MSESWQDLLVADHTVIEKVFAAMNELFSRSTDPRPLVVHDLLTFLVDYVDGCHSKKEEEHLFPLLEARGIPAEGGPLGMMKQEHEESRRLLRQIRKSGRAYLAGDGKALAILRNAFRAFSQLLGNHFWKENDVLYPMGARVFSAVDAARVTAGIAEVEARLGTGARAKYYALAERLTESLEDLSKRLSSDVVAAILNRLPVEISFVDADDRVAYFSHEDQDKIFPRNRSAIGTKVQNCHPEKSVHRVNEILADFKAGKRDVAEFWIDFKDTKVHIRYFPVRDTDGRYLGTLEVVQDVGDIRRLEGERRLLSAESR